ncbi:MAG: hypothetical protein LUD07_09310 [Clostridiales bacterium]|nr:hypothetical protein [Clostridiales bacterium]
MAMNWKEEYIAALDEAKLFENSGHRTRFKELLDCYGGFPFFTKGLCKCIYMSAWDEEHFVIMLETLTDMSLGRERNTGEMTAKGDSLAIEHTEDGEYYLYQLSIALLNNQPWELDPHAALSDDYRYIVTQTLKAAEVIDQADIEHPKN